MCVYFILEDIFYCGKYTRLYTYIYFYIYRYNKFYTCLTDLAVLIKHTRVPCLVIQSIHPVLDTRTVHIVLCIHHLLLLFNNNTNSLLLRRLLWDWLVASQERWVCTKLPMYVLSTFLLTLPYNCCTTVYNRGRDTRFGIRVSQRDVESSFSGALCFLNTAAQIFTSSLWFFVFLHVFELMWRQRGVMNIAYNLLHSLIFTFFNNAANFVCVNLCVYQLLHILGCILILHG